MKKPTLYLRKKYSTNYSDRSNFAANARLLQSIWREEQGIPLKRTWGNYLSKDQAYQEQLNFLTPKIRSVVNNEVEANEKLKGFEKKVIQKDRLYENLLASQPLAFNLFAELITSDYELANKVFKKLFNDTILNVTSIEFEISPGRRNLKYTGDRSAFDVYIQYEGMEGRGFIGIEIKYAETLKDKPVELKPRYLEVAKKSVKFTEDGLTELSKMPQSIEQIWRDHLLSLSMIPPVNNDFEEGFFVYLFPKNNIECVTALSRYYDFLKSKDPYKTGLHILYLEDFVGELKKASTDQWILDFENRYLMFDKIKNIV